MVRRTEAYVDTAALIAFPDRSGSHHTLFRRLFSDPPPLTTSALVIAEGHGWFLRRYDQRRAIEFLAFLRDVPHLRIVPFDKEQLINAQRLVTQFADQSLTLADAHGLAIMRARRIVVCWSTDFHLTLTRLSLVS